MRTGLKSSRGRTNRRRPGGLSPVEDVSFIETHANTKGYVRAKDYDPEQHVFPQRKTNTPLAGAQLGSTKSLEFGKDENGEFVYIDQSSVLHSISTTTESELDNASAWRIEFKVRVDSLHTTYSRFGSESLTSHQLSVRNSDGQMTWYDGDDFITSTSTLPSWAIGDVYVLAWVATGTQYEFYYSTDEGVTWTQVGTGVTPTTYNNHGTATTRTIGHTGAGTN